MTFVQCRPQNMETKIKYLSEIINLQEIFA